jgi:hypothetical protein
MSVIPGQPGGPVDEPGPARAKTCHAGAANHDAGNRACVAFARISFDAGGRTSAAANCFRSATVGTLKPVTTPGMTPGFSHQSSPRGRRPGRKPFTLPPNATMGRDNSGQSGCPGPTPWRRHNQRIEFPKAPRTDAKWASAEPAGSSGRSSHHNISRPERSMRWRPSGFSARAHQHSGPETPPLGACRTQERNKSTMNFISSLVVSRKYDDHFLSLRDLFFRKFAESDRLLARKKALPLPQGGTRGGGRAFSLGDPTVSSRAGRPRADGQRAVTWFAAGPDYWPAIVLAVRKCSSSIGTFCWARLRTCASEPLSASAWNARITVVSSCNWPSR